jgi:hypothetical protein
VQPIAHACCWAAVPDTELARLEQLGEILLRYAFVYPVLMYRDGAGDAGAALYSVERQLLYVKGLPPLTPTMPNAPPGLTVPPHCGYDTS